MIQSPTFWILTAVSVPLFWSLPSRFRPGFLALLSFGYLASLAGWHLVAFLLISLVVYFVGPVSMRPAASARWVTASLILTVCAYLAYFKYVPGLLASLSETSPTTRVLVPLGISYFSFKLLHYVIELSRGELSGHRLQDFLCYVFLFPIFTAGPIERFDHYLASRETRWRLDTTVEGLTRVVHGLVKQMVINGLILSPALGKSSDVGHVLDALEFAPFYKVWGYIVLTYLTIYVDFSAYSDIAIGISRLYGIRIMENFRFPLFAVNTAEYWKRWHISLSNWCQTYVYIPMIGVTRNPYLAAYSSFLVMGIWHAATLGRVCWGLYQATGVIIYMAWSRHARRKRWCLPKGPLWRCLSSLVTLAYIMPSVSFLVIEYRYGTYQAFRILFKLMGVDLPSGTL